MIEVEVKARIEDIESLRKRAGMIGEKVGVEIKVDEYYTLEGKGKYPEKSLRIRHRNGKYEVNFKQRISYKKGVHAKKETEFFVEDIEGFKNLIKDFGFRLWLVKRKRTELYEVKRNFHIELNKVDKLGWFAEIEYLAKDNKEVEKARREVREVFERLGFRDKDIVKQGYTKLLWNKKN